MNNESIFSGYRAMWVVVLFDLPTETTEQKRAYREFRKFLQTDGFFSLQFSVYARYCASEEIVETHKKRVRMHIPEKGEVRIVQFTDKQFGRMEVFSSGGKTDPEQAKKQMIMF